MLRGTWPRVQTRYLSHVPFLPRRAELRFQPWNLEAPSLYLPQVPHHELEELELAFPDQQQHPSKSYHTFPTSNNPKQVTSLLLLSVAPHVPNPFRPSHILLHTSVTASFSCCALTYPRCGAILP